MSMIHQLAAFVVGAKYKLFWGYLIAAWLWGLILDEFLVSGSYRITVRNLGLVLVAWVLIRFISQRQNYVLAAAYAVAKR